MDPNFQRWKMMQDLNPGGGVWWANMPLPPGWEAKYDHNSKKYFFIHHATRSTQWVDPRKAYYEQQQRGGMAPPPGPRMPQSSPRMPAVRAGPAIPMRPIAKPKCKTCKINEVPSANQDCQGCQLKARQREAELVRAREAEEAERRKQENEQRIQKEQERRRVQSAARSRSPMPADTNETSFSGEIERQELTVGQKRAMIDNLDEAFPGIERTVVEMVVESSSWDTEKAVSVLSTMSPQKGTKVKPKAPKPPTASPSKAPAAKAAVPKATAAQSQPTDATKKKMRDYLKKTFPSASETLVDLALETTKYNQAKASQVLRMTLTDTSKTAAKKTDTKAKTTASSSTSYTISLSSQAGSLGSTSAPPKTSAPAPVVASASVSKPTPSSTTTTTTAWTATFPSTSSPSISKASGVPHQSKTTGRAKGGARRTRSAERAPRQEFDSLFSVSTQGPDASLVSGPNKDNLLVSYVEYKGSDKSIIQGPSKDNVMGPSTTNGHDASLVAGPQGSHYTGPQASLAKGSMYKSDRQM